WRRATEFMDNGSGCIDPHDYGPQQCPSPACGLLATREQGTRGELVLALEIQKCRYGSEIRPGEIWLELASRYNELGCSDSVEHNRVAEGNAGRHGPCASS